MKAKHGIFQTVKQSSAVNHKYFFNNAFDLQVIYASQSLIGLCLLCYHSVFS